MYTLSNSRQNFDLKYQMPKYNMHVNLLFCTKAFLFVCKNNRCGQRTHKASSSSTNHSFPGIICWVSETTAVTFSGQSKQKTLPPFSGMFLSFSNLPISRSHVGHSISLVYLEFLTLSATNSKLFIKVQLLERQFLDCNHAEKV